MSTEAISAPHVAEADLRLIRSLWTQSGYRCVYQTARGQWAARLRLGVAFKGSGRPGRSPLVYVSPRCDHPREAAKWLVQWYRDTFGEARWRKLVERRRLRWPWRVTRAGDVWRLSVWEYGECKEIAQDFGTKEAARDYAIELANRSVDQWRILWRVE